MTTEPDPAYAYEIIPVTGRPSVFSWVIRHRGNTYERADRFSFSEDDAIKKANEAIERARHNTK